LNLGLLSCGGSDIIVASRNTYDHHRCRAIARDESIVEYLDSLWGVSYNCSGRSRL